MKIRSNRFSNHRGLWVACLVIAVLGAAALLLVAFRHNSELKSTQKTSTSTGAHATNTINHTPAPAADNAPSEATKNSPPASSTTGTTNSSPANYKAQIVSASVNNGNVHIGTLVTGTSTGSCNLSASQPGQSTISLGNSSVRQDVNNYSCGVFNVSTSTFPTTGTWKLSLTVSVPNSASTTGTYNVVIPNNS